MTYGIMPPSTVHHHINISNIGTGSLVGMTPDNNASYQSTDLARGAVLGHSQIHGCATSPMPQASPDLFGPYLHNHSLNGTNVLGTFGNLPDLAMPSQTQFVYPSVSAARLSEDFAPDFGLDNFGLEHSLEDLSSFQNLDDFSESFITSDDTISATAKSPKNSCCSSKTAETSSPQTAMT